MFAAVAGKYGKFIIGPICTDYCSNELSDKIKWEHNISGVYRISLCTIESFCEEVLLLHNFINDCEMGYEEIIQSDVLQDEIMDTVKKELANVYFDYHENEKLHNPYDRERREVESIRTGDTVRLKAALDEVFPGQYGVLSKDKLRSSKSLAICGITLASRAGIDGGINPEIAFSICDSYILKIDEARQLGEIVTLAQQAKFYFAGLVKEQKLKKNKNELIEECKKLIYKSIHGKIQVKYLAGKLHINSDYLSHLFVKNEGIKIHEFIEKEKVYLTENMLIYSMTAFEDIGYYLGFSSQSHFGKVFKKWKNMTPKQYREQFGVKEFLH